MKILAPDYYRSFRCIASKCRHNCCIGWEIDIDEDTYGYYKNVNGDFGRRLRENISEEECPHFVLGEKERCPFLNSDNLCDIIINLGDVALCRICNDHPRFRNFYSDAEEIGVGLSCESAAELIVGKKDKTGICILSDDGENGETLLEEKEFFELRQEIFDILQDRSKAVRKRLCEALELCGVKDGLNGRSLAELYNDLEYMDDGSRERITSASEKHGIVGLPQETEVPFEQIAVYFVFRHLAKILDGEQLTGVMFFCVAGTEIIMRMCEHHFEKHGNITVGVIAEYARLYSAEIEYSEDNTYGIIESAV